VGRNVTGLLFLDYVKMIRSRRDVDWSRHLRPEDLAYLDQAIEPKTWYPVEVFEQFGLAILHEVAQGDLQVVRQWGQASIEQLGHPGSELIVDRDPRESVMRVHVLRNSFFDYQAIDVEYLRDGEAHIRVEFGMRPVAEEAAAWQTLGFFERLVEVAGASSCTAVFASRSWESDPATIIDLRWS
jgi:hypothetical protein